ncbi:MAG: inositol phosphorylceramide synthase [Bacteroidaceae bacterium]|nr:inositol phosphorylceramide synthase [Bacteroidaceae bacterium]
MKRFILSLIGVFAPILLYAVLYFAMGLWPSCNMPHIDVRELYEAEKAIFGIATEAGTQTPGEWFAEHTYPLADLYAGFSYLCWVPLPVLFAFVLFFREERPLAFRFMMAFLVVNLIGFAGYYLHPAAPPWYVMQHGFEVIKGTPGNAAGLIRFDELVGIPVFQSIYTGNSNVFAAVPSLHSAYLPITLFYALKSRHARGWLPIIVVVMFGIWFAAVYSAHHYCIDVLLGILTALFGVILFEKGFKSRTGKALFQRYADFFALKARKK